MEYVKSTFKPEFINRLDDIILFNRLKEKDISAIVDIQLASLKAALAEKNIVVTINQSLKDWLAKEGYDHIYGARPLKRTIQHHLENLLAEMLLDGKINDGDVLVMDYNSKKGVVLST